MTTTVSYALGRPRAAVSRGGDCRAYDIAQARNVHGPHRFAAPSGCRLLNGLLRVTVGASGAAPALTVEAYRGRTTVGDVFVDVFHDLFGGSESAATWAAIGTLTIDSPSVSALLSGVQVASINPEAVTVRLVSPLMADAFVTLRRGEPFVRIHHGDTRANPLVDIDRRVRFTASPSLVGSAVGPRVEEPAAVIAGVFRWVGAMDAATADAGAFSITASSTTSARFGAGAATSNLLDTPSSQHAQLGDASRTAMVVS